MIIAGTGHRPEKLGGYSPHTTLRVLQFATSYLQEARPSVVISGMAQGWDMALAQAAINLSIPFWAYVPFQGQEDVWPSATKLYYRVLLTKAAKVEICSPGGYRPISMQIRNQRMVDDCDLLAALWDGSNGGTSNAIAYATFAGKPFINLWSRYTELYPS